MKIKIFFAALSLVLFAHAAHGQVYYFDDSDSSFSTTGSWTVNPNKPGAYQDSHTWSHFLHPSGGGNVSGLATWNVSSASGKYRVLVRWHELANRATDAKYQVNFDGSQNSGDILIDQTSASQYSPDAEGFVSLGDYCDPSSVTLSNVATQGDTPSYSGYVSADAVKIVGIGPCDAPASGKAYFGGVRAGATNVNTSGFTYLFLSNVTEQEVSVSVKLYLQDGSLITDDGSATTGQIVAGGVFTGYNDSSGVNFTLPAKSTLEFYYNPGSSPNLPDVTRGFGEIEWTSTTPVSGDAAILARGFFLNIDSYSASGIHKESQSAITVNGGKPF